MQRACCIDGSARAISMYAQLSVRIVNKSGFYGNYNGATDQHLRMFPAEPNLLPAVFHEISYDWAPPMMRTMSPNFENVLLGTKLRKPKSGFSVDEAVG